MDFGNPLTEDPDPLLWPAQEDVVAAIEVKLHIRAFELVDILSGFHGAEQEIVPDILDGNGHFQFFSQRNSFFDFLHRSFPAIVVAYLLTDPSGYE